MSTRKTRQQAGEAILAVLKDAAPAGFSKAELIENLGLTASQIANGLVWIREVGASQEGLPFTYTRKAGYQFSDDSSVWAFYERTQMLRVLTTLVRLARGTLDPHLSREPGDAFARMLSTQMSGMISALEYATTPPPPAATSSSPTT